MRKFERGTTTWLFGLLDEEDIFPSPAANDPVSLYNYASAQAAICVGDATRASCVGEVKRMTYAQASPWGDRALTFTHTVFYGMLQTIFIDRPISQTITYRTTGLYRSTVTSFDGFNSPETVQEQSTSSPLIRETHRTYFNNAAHHIIELPATETIAGAGTQTFTRSLTGQVTAENHYGILKTYDYYPHGQLKHE